MADRKHNADDFAAICVVALIAQKRKQRKRKRTIWVQPWIDNRLTHGAYNALVLELDGQSYKNFLRMDRSSFDLLLEKVWPVVEWQDTRMCRSISAEERLAVTLRYLATGETCTTYLLPILTRCSN